jgi:hypothetical protein
MAGMAAGVVDDMEMDGRQRVAKLLFDGLGDGHGGGPCCGATHPS